MSVEISAENRQEYQAWTPVEEDLEGLPKNIYDVILQMRVDCSTTDRNRMPYYGAVDDIDEFTDIPYIDDGTRAHQLDIHILTEIEFAGHQGTEPKICLLESQFFPIQQFWVGLDCKRVQG